MKTFLIIAMLFVVGGCSTQVLTSCQAKTACIETKQQMLREAAQNSTRHYGM